MNKRINEFVEQATTYIEPTYSSGEGWIFDKEKFAELIIRECADIVENQGRFLKYDVLAKKIKENFEIKK
jgi:hypothetical protein